MFQRLRVIAILLGSLTCLVAQDIDSVPSLQKRNLASIADEIGDSAERSAFLQLFKPDSSGEMRARAEAFLARFPQSGFLAQAYELAARGCFDLTEYEQGLGYAQQSLALLPENPLLLVPVADVEARRNLNSAAIDHADEALGDLDRFARAASVREEDWPNVKQRLKSTANFAKGRALLQEALAQPAGEGRKQLLKKSEAALLDAQHFNYQDLEIAYVLGLAQFSSGRSLEASSNFAASYRGGGELAPKALESLQSIYRLLYPNSTVSFDTFVQHAGDRWATALQNSKQSIDRKVPARPATMSYFGSDSCRAC